MLSHQSHMFQRFHLFLASLVMSRKNIWLEWFGRGNIDDIETPGVRSLWIYIYSILKNNNKMDLDCRQKLTTKKSRVLSLPAFTSGHVKLYSELKPQFPEDHWSEETWVWGSPFSFAIRSLQTWTPDKKNATSKNACLHLAFYSRYISCTTVYGSTAGTGWSKFLYISLELDQSERKQENSR